MELFVNIGKSIVDLKSYKAFAQKSFGQACLHVLVVVVLYAIAITIAANIVFLPPVNQFIDLCARCSD